MSEVDQDVSSQGDEMRTGVTAHWKSRRRWFVLAMEFITVVMLAVTAIAAWRSAALTAQSTKQTIQFQSELSANETWSQYRELQLKYLTDYGMKVQYPTSDFKRDTYFELLNERLLMVADLVSYSREVDKSWNDPQWQDTVASEIVANRSFIISDKFLKGSNLIMSGYCTYRSPVRKWISTSFANDRLALAKLNNAERECERICKTRPGCT